MRVVVAGGGIAALEVLAGLRALAGERVEATLLAPDRSFCYRPLSTAVPFTFRDERTRPLKELAGGLGADFVRDGLAQVDQSRSRVLTHDGDFVPYDALVIAVGARTDHRGADTTWRRGGNGAAQFVRILQELEAGSIRSVAFLVPPRAAWPVDAYELALVASLAAQRAGSAAKISLFTAEEAPLRAFGRGTAGATSAELARSGIELVTGVEASRAQEIQEAGRDAFSSVVARLSRGGRRGDRRDELVLRLRPGSSVAVDRALFLPAVRGPAVAGVLHDQGGFIPVDEHARVLGQNGVYAAGDATQLALKHSTLASSQATAAAEAIAAAAGVDIDPQPWSPTLYGILTLPPHFPGAPGSPWLSEGEPVTHCLWWPPGHVAGRHLAPYLASTDPGVRPGLEWHPHGIPVAVRVTASAAEAAAMPATPTDAGIRQDVITRQLLAVRRAEREGEKLEHTLERKGDELDRRQREVVQQLRAAGYLRDR